MFDAVVREPDEERRESMMAEACRNRCRTASYAARALWVHYHADQRGVSNPEPESIRTLLGTLTEEVNRVGAVEGGYRLTQEIGHGAMGTVYDAERSDGHFPQAGCD